MVKDFKAGQTYIFGLGFKETSDLSEEDLMKRLDAASFFLELKGFKVSQKLENLRMIIAESSQDLTLDISPHFTFMKVEEMVFAI